MIRFDSSRAWDEAMRIVSANREILIVLAGVFFFLPGIAAVFFMTPIQGELAAFQAKMGPKPSVEEMQALLGIMGQMMPIILAVVLVQAFGRMAMMALVTDQRRPTVGEALGIALKCLPALIGTYIVVFLAYFLIFIVGGTIAGLLSMGVAYAQSPVLNSLFAAVLAGGALVGVLFAYTRLLLLIQVIVIDGEHRPVQAIKNSWKMVKGNTGRVFLFYMLLFVAGLVISLVASFGLEILGGLIGSAGMLLVAVGSSLISSVIGVVMTGVLVAMHQQLSQEQMEVAAETPSVWGS